MQDWLSNPIVYGALNGLWVAVLVDLRRWLASTGWAVEGFVLSTASKAWVTGLIGGALLAAGVN